MLLSLSYSLFLRVTFAGIHPLSCFPSFALSFFKKVRIKKLLCVFYLVIFIFFPTYIRRYGVHSFGNCLPILVEISKYSKLTFYPFPNSGQLKGANTEVMQHIWGGVVLNVAILLRRSTPPKCGQGGPLGALTCEIQSSCCNRALTCSCSSSFSL